jgi:hypothetical protein
MREYSSARALAVISNTAAAGIIIFIMAATARAFRAVHAHSAQLPYFIQLDPARLAASL